MSGHDLATQYLERLLGEKIETPLSRRQEKRLRAALQRAEQIRDFEIKLYWTRSAYFWGMQVALFGAFGLVTQAALKEVADPHHTGESFASVILVAISSLATLTSLVWFLMATGAKYWQDNWERHIDVLEEFAYGPLYKTYFIDEKEISTKTDFKPISVSKSNKLIAKFIAIFWFCTSFACWMFSWSSWSKHLPPQDILPISLFVIIYSCVWALTCDSLSRNLRMTNFGTPEDQVQGASHRLILRRLLEKD